MRNDTGASLPSSYSYILFLVIVIFNADLDFLFVVCLFFHWSRRGGGEQTAMRLGGGMGGGEGINATIWWMTMNKKRRELQHSHPPPCPHQPPPWYCQHILPCHLPQHPPRHPSPCAFCMVDGGRGCRQCRKVWCVCASFFVEMFERETYDVSAVRHVCVRCEDSPKSQEF